METLRGAFTLLSLLFLAASTVQAVKYKGPSSRVHEGEPWSIECTDFGPTDSVRWTRDGHSLEPELSSGKLGVLTKTGTSMRSSLTAMEAHSSHVGAYKCTTESTDAFTLSVYPADRFRVLSKESIPLILECGNKTGRDNVRWFKEKMDVSVAFKKFPDAIRVDNETNNLEIRKEIDDALGNYSCTVNNVSSEFKVVARPTVMLSESTTVVEGEKLHLICGGKQSPGVKVMWTFGDKNYTHSEGRVKLSKDEERGIAGAVLNVDNIEMSDRGNISCRVSYNWSDPIATHQGEAVVLLRVKDKLAALWPFLGICAEVVVLCAIILIYEKKRNKAELEESDTDQSPDTKPTPNKDSDVRQRK